MSVAENPIGLLQVNATDKHLLQKFNKRIERGNLTRDDDPINHLIVYFLVYDQYKREVFIGHHIKSGLWLANGGHMERGESPVDAANREMDEELGKIKMIHPLTDPSFLSITTDIDNPGKPCRTHFDIWFFVEVDKNNFDPDKSKIAQEFEEMRWFGVHEARHIVTDLNTLEALAYLEKGKMSL